MLLLLLKLTMAPGAVVGASLAGRRWGPRVGGILIALPLVAGPILLIITLQEGQDFGARAARGSLLGVVALSAFCLVFASVVALRWWQALLAGWAVFAVVGGALSGWDAPPLLGLACALAAIGAAYAGIRPGAEFEVPVPPWWDLYARAATTAVLVVVITTAADALGPGLSGILTPFPIATSVLAAFALAHGGPEAARAMLRGFLLALPGFSVFFCSVAVLLS